jgi:hypothetical protein
VRLRSLARKASSARLRSDISMFVPYHFDDFARFIAQRIRPDKKPSIDSIEAAMSRFHLGRLASGQAQLPLSLKPVAIVGMNHSSPAPSLCVLRGGHREAGVLLPLLIEELRQSVGRNRPGEPGNRIEDRANIIA